MLIVLSLPEQSFSLIHNSVKKLVFVLKIKVFFALNLPLILFGSCSCLLINQVYLLNVLIQLFEALSTQNLHFFRHEIDSNLNFKGTGFWGFGGAIRNCFFHSV